MEKEALDSIERKIEITMIKIVLIKPIRKNVMINPKLRNVKTRGAAKGIKSLPSEIEYYAIVEELKQFCLDLLGVSF